MNKIKEGV